MDDLIAKALSAKRETKSIEFKQGFDVQSPRDWCELIKDLAAIANSGGGIIIFGLDSSGVPVGQPVDAICAIDPADIGSKVSRYTGLVDFEFEIRTLEKSGNKLAAFVIPAVSVPLVFEKPGTYEIGGGKQSTAFSVGTVYFRHGAKSEPGTSEDIRRVIERQLEQIRKSWIKNVKKVVRAPPGSQVVTLLSGKNDSSLSSQVRVVQDPNAIPVRLTRDPAVVSGTFIHEELSDGIFDEINNVIDANRVLAKGQKGFFLGQPVYYRIYAERQHVRQSEDYLSVLLKNGMADFYAPSLFWAITLPDSHLVKMLANLYLYPTNRHVHSLMRVSTLLGQDFSEWLLGKWNEKWRRHPQPPAFYFTFKKTIAEMTKADARVIASRFSPAMRVTVSGESPVLAKDLIDKPEQAAALLSKACIQVFQGANDHRTIARNLDYLAYGPQVQSRASVIVKDVLKTIGDRKPGDVVETSETEG